VLSDISTQCQLLRSLHYCAVSATAQSQILVLSTVDLTGIARYKIITGYFITMPSDVMIFLKTFHTFQSLLGQIPAQVTQNTVQGHVSLNVQTSFKYNCRQYISCFRSRNRPIVLYVISFYAVCGFKNLSLTKTANNETRFT
jgi:hypothetical protein